MLACQKDLFSLPPEMHYLNCANLSPLMKSFEAAGIAGIQRKSIPRLQPVDWFPDVQALRSALAELIHASDNQIALIPAVSYGVAIATHHIRLKPGQNVVLPGEEFPSNVYGWMERCKQDGGTLRFVARPEPKPGAGKEWSDK